MTTKATLLQWYILMICAVKIGASTLRHRPPQVSTVNEAARIIQRQRKPQRPEDAHEDHEHRSLIEFNENIENPFVCGSECSDDEFCGRDLRCHKFESCELWYELGHPALTGREEDEITEETKLNCVGIDDGLDRSFLWSSGICGDYSVPLAAAYVPFGINPDDIYSSCSRVSEYDENESRAEFGIAFTRLCAAEPKPDHVFRCYDFSPNTNLSQHISDSFPPSDTEDQEGQFQVFQIDVWFSETEFVEENGQTYPSITSHWFGNTKPNATTALDPNDLAGLLTSSLYENSSPDFVSSFPTDCMCKANEFCGIDGNCHAFTCDQMFEFGPRDFTGYDEFPAGSTPQLSCSEYEPCHLANGDVEPRTDNANDVCKFRFGEASTYRCSEDNTWSSHNVPFQDDPFLPFSRSCTVTTPIGGKFTCVDMVDTTQEDLDRYVNATMELGEVCSAEDASYFPDDDIFPDRNFSRYFVFESCTAKPSLSTCTHVPSSRNRYFEPLKALAAIQSDFEPGKSNGTSKHNSSDVVAADLMLSVLAWMTVTGVVVLGF